MQIVHLRQSLKCTLGHLYLLPFEAHHNFLFLTHTGPTNFIPVAIKMFRFALLASLKMSDEPAHSWRQDISHEISH